jgi:uncharacterized membrane protein
MELSINTPALLFPAISLLLLAYTNRFLAIANLVRKLFDEYNKVNDKQNLAAQIKSLRNRLNYIHYMLGFGVFSFLLCVSSMYFVYNMWHSMAEATFAVSLIALMISLIFSLVEILQSTAALELLLSEVEGLTDPSLLDKMLHRKEESKD